MKNNCILLFAFVYLCSCTKTEKSMFNAPCTDSCTTVQGRFITGNDEGIPNISFEIKSIKKPTLGLGLTTIRNIASGKTDNNGFFSSTFLLQKGEYGQMADAVVSIYFNYDKLKFIPVIVYENFGASEVLGAFKRKDTTITASIYLTSRSKLKVRLENFVPLQSGDFFSVITSCGAGLNRKYTTGGFIEAAAAITEKEIDACGNELTTVIIRKRKNGVSSSSSITIATPTGQTIPITFTY